MKKISNNNHSKASIGSWLAVFALVAFCSFNAMGQFSISGSAGGTLDGTYASLTGPGALPNAGGGVFAALNSVAQTGAIITVAVTGDSPAEPGTNSLFAGAWTSITISPSGGVARTISGTTTAVAPLQIIDFNGADNVTIDGLNSGGNSLTIANLSTLNTSGTSTIKFIGGATNNTITNCNIQGSGTMSVATNGATIFFSTDANTANGNDNNTISNCNIGPAGANLPTKAILGNGSTTTNAIGNSGNIINNNNIFDYFGAAVTSSGIAINGGCNTWSITNNRFYQTGTRTWTTGATHRAIDLNSTAATSGVQGMTVTGNIVGYASNTQTGTYTLTGSTGKFQGIVFNGITGGTVSNINTNTVASVSLTGVTSSGTSTSSPFVGMLVTNGLANTNSNTIGSQSATGSLTFSTTTTTTTEIMGIFNFSFDDWTANSNTVGGISVTNAAASGTFITFGLRANTTTGKVFNASSNFVGGTIANSIQLNSTGTASQVIGMITPNATATWTSNTVRNMTNNNGTGTTTTASMIGMSLTSTTPNQTVSQNTIFNLTNSNTTAATVVTGIQFTGSTVNVVERNLIYGLTSATNSATAEVNGIRVAGGTTTYRNNMIAIGAGITNAIGAVATNSSTAAINGIMESLGTNSFFHNSVYIGGTATAGTGASFAFNGVQTTNTRSFRDNIFFNARTNSGATGKHYAVKINGTTPNPTGLTINNNLYFANGTGAVFGFFNSLDVANIAAWKIAVGQDAGSFESNPQYNDPTNATPDLHLHPTNATVAEANGFDVGVVNDYDGQTRSGLTPVDIGADAGNFVGIDLAPPVIVYTPLGNTSLITNRTLASTITDVTSGVPTSGIGLPVIYFRKGVSDPFSSTQAVSGGAGSYTFTIDYSLVTGGSVTNGDVIQYYVVAQDGAATPNVTSNPSSGASGYTANPPAAGTPPTTPNSYLISIPLSGTYTIPGSYPSLTNAGGIFEAINNGVVTGNLNIEIAADLTGELGTFGLNTIAEQPAASNFTVKLYPTGVARSITGSFNGALIRANGSSRVTIDGSIGGAGTDRSLTISNTSVTSPSVVLFGSIGTTPITNNTLRNCIIINGINTSSAVVISDATTLGNAGYFSNITIQNNDVQKAFVGVFATGGTTPQNGSNLTYTQNTVNTSGTNAIRDVGLYMQGVNGATVTQNTVGNFSTVDGENDCGIWLATGTGNATVSGNTVANLGMTPTSAFAPIGIRESSGLATSGNVISGNTVSNITTNGGTAVIGIENSGSGTIIEKNNVSGIINNNTGTFGAYGINISAGNNSVIRNNFVSNVMFNMSGGAAFSTQFGIFGIRIATGTGHQVYFNSVNLSGLLPGTAATSLLSAAFGLVSTASTGCDVRNNIFANNITGGTTSIAHVAAFLPSGGTSAMNLTWNNNAYFYGTDAARQGVGQAGTTAGTNFFTTLPTLAAYSGSLSGAATNDNASKASTSAVPFTSSTDLHLTNAAGTNYCLNGTGVTIGSVTVDYDVETRGTPPDIGADEFVAVGDAVATPASQTVCSGTPFTTIVLSGTAASYNWSRNNAVTVTGIAASGTGNISGTLTNTTNAQVTVTFTITPVDAAGCPGPSITATIVVDPGTNYYADNDGDGYGAGAAVPACTAPIGYVTDNTDCDDTPVTGAGINPGATEVCDGIDQDCEGGIDEGVQTTFFADDDADSYGNLLSTTMACTAPVGYVTDNTDCDDTPVTGAGINPGATEVCDGIDQDCDMMVDEGVQTTYYADADGDTYGDPSTSTMACTAPVGYVTDNTDCDDTPVTGTAINPGATEVCNGVDDDCEGGIDEGVQTTYYADADGDTYGDPSTSTMACTAPVGYVTDNTDCDDTPVTGTGINPGATEVCNGIDDDCEGGIDEGVQNTYYADADGDTYGDPSTSTMACTAPVGYVTDNTDCDDTPVTGTAINPGATEVCNGVDDDCEGGIDEGVQTTYYADADSDTYGDPSTTTMACTAPVGYVTDTTDCDDTPVTGTAINPGATEVCNGIDDDCEGGIDEGVQNTYYADADGDTYGDPSTSTMACTAPVGYVTDNTDCDDTPVTGAGIYPGATEVCDGIDQDCDMSVDEGILTTFYADADGDTYGDPVSTIMACTAPIGYVADNTDCNDTPVTGAGINPGATEICNGGIDDDCDLLADNADPSVTGQSTWYQDADSDGLGNLNVVQMSCSQPSGYVTNSLDCNDNSTVSSCDTPTNPSVSGLTDVAVTLSWNNVAGAERYNLDFKLATDPTYPPSIKVYTNSYSFTGLLPGTKYSWRVRANCDTLCSMNSANLPGGSFRTNYRGYPDADADGFGDATQPYVLLANFPTPGYSLNNLDCNDANNAIRPNATEICNMVDDDCDIAIDEGTTTTTWYQDADGDGLGNAAVSQITCLPPFGYVTNDLDCNDLSNVAVCSVPTGVSAEMISQFTATLVWQTSPCVTFYQIKYKKSTDLSWTNVSPVNGGNYPLSGLTPGSLYNYQVRSRCTATTPATTSNWASGSFTTLSMPMGFADEDSGQDNTPQSSDNDIDVYPNPGDGIFNIRVQSSLETEATMMLTDELGRLVLTNKWSLFEGQNIYQLDMTSMTSGVYQVQLLKGDLILTKKIVLMK